MSMTSTFDICTRITARSRDCLQHGKAGTKVPRLALLTRFAAVLGGDTLTGQQSQVPPGAFPWSCSSQGSQILCLWEV